VNNASVTAPPPKPANLPDRPAGRRAVKAALAGGAGGLVALLFFLLEQRPELARLLEMEGYEAILSEISAAAEAR